jgi:hypothetical protein
MTIGNTLAPRETTALALPSHPKLWIKDGWRMARREHAAVFESIDMKHVAETYTHTALADKLKARGRAVLDERTELDRHLTASAFSYGEHLRNLAHGKVDLAWALGLLVLNAALALFVLLGFGPWFLTIPLALLVLVTALPVEEFFQAYDEKATLREAVFLTLAILALGAQFWLGTIRGLFLTALTPTDAGPVTHALRAAAPALRYGLGILTMVSECICGYKLQRARTQLLSATARSVRARDRCTREMVALHGAIKAADAEPDVRRAYRPVGARQYLGEQAQAPGRAERQHLGRALIVASLVLLALAALFAFASDAFAEPAAQRVVVLLDLTKSVSADSFQANVQGVNAVLGRLASGDQVSVLGITDSFGRPRMLIHRTLPATGYLGLEFQAGRELLTADWRRVAEHLAPTYQRTDLLGCLALVPFLDGAPGAPSDLIVFSDLRQSSRLLNLEAMPQIDVARTVARLGRGQAIPALLKTRVFLLGVDSTGVTAAYYASLRAFWLRVFGDAGAHVKQFSIGRDLNGFVNR